MPRFRNIFDYSTDDKVHRPKETLIDVPETDSVSVITINIENGGFVQLRRMEDNSKSNEWQVITSLELTKIVRTAYNNFSR